MDISSKPLKNQDVIGNYIINNVSYKDIISILPQIEDYINKSKIENIKNDFEKFKSVKDIELLEDILNNLETEISLNVGYLILSNNKKFTNLSDEGKYTFLTKKPIGGVLEIVLLDNERKIYVGNLTLLKINDKKLIKIFGTRKTYQISYISLDQRLTGQGLGGTFYELIYKLDEVEVLLSSDNLYKGSFSVWSKTLKNVGKYHGIIVEGKNLTFPSKFNSLNTTPYNEPSIAAFFISKTMAPNSEELYNKLDLFENKKTIFYYTSKDISSIFSILKPLEQIKFNINSFNDLVEGELDSEIPNMKLNIPTYDFILNLENQNIDITDNNVTNVCIFGKNGEINISQKGNKLKINIL
jgi:hypothetical protein